MQTLDLDALQNAVVQRYGFDGPGVWSPIFNGDECLVWRVEQGESLLIVRISPAWRTPAELQWTHDLTLHCGQSIPEVVAPLRARDGSTLFVFEDCPVTLYPFVSGKDIDTENMALVQAAARLLARIHKAAVRWPEQRPRPASKTTRPQPLPPERYPEVFQDPELDAWEAWLDQTDTLVFGPIHADYYSRNVLATDTTITGVIDWDEAYMDHLMAEVGWSAWEFAQNWTGDDLFYDRAALYLEAYFAEDPPCPRHEVEHAVQFIRRRLRRESVLQLAAAERGEDWEQEYTEQEMRAFAALKGQSL
jgi:Ser/Thr protein kinase RdoA (MazF antagonist)